jgi:LAO/AO transport system kinase
LEQDARRIKSEYLSAVKYIRKKTKFWSPKVILTSASKNIGIDKLWEILCEYKKVMIENDEFHSKRKRQMELWFWAHLKENLLGDILTRPEMKQQLVDLKSKVLEGTITPGTASDLFIENFNKLFLSK